jgi:ribose transport system substrate-binding protein
MSKPDRYYVEAAARVLDVLELFDHRETLRLTDVVKELGLIKSSAFRFLYTLERKGYIERMADGRTFRRRRPRRVGLVSISEKIPFVAEVERGIQEAAGRAGLTLIVRHHYFDPGAVLKGVEEVLAEGAALVIVYNPDEHISHLIADRCARAQAPIVAITFPVPGARLFGINNYRAGLAGGEGLGEHLQRSWGALDRVVLLDIPGSSPAQQARMTGMLEGLRKYVRAPDDILCYLHAGREKGTARELMVELLAKHPRARRIAVLCYNDLNAIGALQAAEACGRTKDVQIVSQGAVAEVRDAILRKGSPLWGAVAHFPERFGAKLIPLVQGVLRGDPVPQTTYTEHVLLTRENLRRYYR